MMTKVFTRDEILTFCGEILDNEWKEIEENNLTRESDILREYDAKDDIIDKLIAKLDD